MSSYNREEFDKYNKFASNSVRSKGAETIIDVKKGTKRTSKDKRKLKVINSKKLISRFLIMVLLILGLAKGVSYTYDYASRHIAYNNALEDFRPHLAQFLTEAEVDFAISKDKKIVILDDNIKDIENLQQIMKEKVGLTSRETTYVLKELSGKDAFDKSANAMGYNDSEEFLKENYSSGSLSYDGERYLTKHPDVKKFENNQEQAVYNKLIEFQEKEELKIQEYLEAKKGMSK